MNTTKIRRLLPALLLACAFPALAQDSAASDQTVAILQIKSGQAALSTGGEFAPVASGQRVEPGYRVMLMEGDSVRLVYDNDCDVTYNQPGVYTVEHDCTPVAAMARGNTGVIAGVVAGAVLIGAAAGGGGGSSTPPPPPPPTSP